MFGPLTPDDGETDRITLSVVEGTFGVSLTDTHLTYTSKTNSYTVGTQGPSVPRLLPKIPFLLPVLILSPFYLIQSVVTDTPRDILTEGGNRKMKELG